MKKKKRIMTRRQRMAFRRRLARPRGKWARIFLRFQIQIGFMMHSPSREYRDSDAAKTIVRHGRAALMPVAAALTLNYGRRPRGTSGSGDGYWLQFTVWTFLVNDVLREVGRGSPYSSSTPYLHQRMEVYVKACVDAYYGRPQDPEIHHPLADSA